VLNRLAIELGAPTLAKCILQDRIKAPRGRRLGNVTGKVVPDPVFIPTSLGELLERMPGKSKRLEQPLEFVRSGFALGGLRFTSRHPPSSTVCSRFTHQIETVQSFAKRGVTDIAASIQDDGAGPFISGIASIFSPRDSGGFAAWAERAALPPVRAVLITIEPR
jgi:hypothetical protein